jgi:hypothetical protein
MRLPILRLSAIFFMTIALGKSVNSVRAQGGVVNGDMEQGFSSRDGVAGVPLGWGFKIQAGTPDADRQAFAPYARSAPTFWAMRDKFESWVATGYQPVAATPGTTYEMGAFVFIWTCNDEQYSCINDVGQRISRKETARARIGIDPTGGQDPNAGSVVWGPWVQYFDEYQGTQVRATASANQVTVFLQGDSGTAMAFNEVYWDDISLLPTTPAGANPAVPGVAAPAAPAAPPPAPAGVPFVTPQQARPDGSVVHTVKEGDTLSSILYAYTPLGISKASVMELNGWRYEPQFITIGQEIKILQPGSVDPATGQLLVAPAAQSALPAGAAPSGGTPVAGTPTPLPAGAIPPAVTPTPLPEGAIPPALTPTPQNQEVANTGATTASAAPPASTGGMLAQPAAPETLRRLGAAEASALLPIEPIPSFVP